MGRLARRWLGRGVYHVYNRAHGGAWVLAEPELKRQFLDRLVRFLPRQEMQVYHWAVMGNHFHLAAARGASRRRWVPGAGFPEKNQDRQSGASRLDYEPAGDLTWIYRMHRMGWARRHGRTTDIH